MTADTGPPSGSVSSAAVAIALLVTFLAVTNVARSTIVPGRWHLAFNLAIGAGAVTIGLIAGLGPGELGLLRSNVTDGFRLGAIAFAVISVVVIGAGVAGMLTDGRVDGPWSTMVVRTLVVIPLGTVLVEELVFRGVLHGLLVRVTSTTGVLVAGAVLFGLWHVFPAWRGGGVETDLADVGRVATVAATLAATTAAGALLVWLRIRSGSVVAPMLAHLATNSVTFAVAWALH